MPVPLLEVGRIVKPHGLHGEVIVELVTNRLERVAPGSSLMTDGGPLEVESSSPHLGRFIVTFAGVGNREAADRLRGVILRAEPLADSDSLWVHDLIGATVRLASREVVGTVEAVQANPASDLLVLDGGQLVPLRFVISQEAGEVVIDPPPGLLEL
jgi:16S rRNA processing protein RimM